MADQSSGTPRPLGARPFARPYTGPAGAAQPRDAKTTPARPALPPFAPAAIAVPQSVAGPAEQAAPMPEAVALLQEDRGSALSLGREATSEAAPPIEVEAPPVAADAMLRGASEPDQSRGELPDSGAILPVVRSRDIWTPEWTPVVVPSVTNTDSLAEPPTFAEQASAMEEEGLESAAHQSSELETVDTADPSRWAAQEEAIVPLFRDAETEPVAPSDRSAPLGHWTDAPSAESVGDFYRSAESPSHVDAAAPAPTIDDVSGSLDDSPVAMTAEPEERIDDDRNVGSGLPTLMDVVAAERDEGSKEQQYADVLEAVALRVRAGEIQLPVAPGTDDEAAILAAVLASLLSSR